MGKYDWYQRTTWTEQDQADFWARWKRSRSERPHYLKEQGSKLISTGKPDLILEGIKLLEFVIEKFADDPFKISTSRIQLGFGLGKLGKYEEGLKHLRDAADAENSDGAHYSTFSEVSLIVFIIFYDLFDYYEEAKQTLTSYVTRMGGVLDRTSKFNLASCHAILHAHYGNANEARSCALLAIEQVDSTNSGISRHPTIGLVPVDREPYRTLLNKIRKLV